MALSTGKVTNISITRNLKILRESKHSQLGEKLRYSLAHAMQIAPETAILFVSTEVVGGKALDYTGGTDAIIFDDLSAISEENTFPLYHNEEFIHPETGEKCILMKFAQTAGFVPLGAKNREGRKHPHAGTGFGLFFVQSIPVDMPKAEGFAGKWAEGENVYRAWELLQYRYDGKNFTVVDSKRFAATELLPGHTVVGRGLSFAIPDGNDLLLPMQAAPGMADESRMTGFAEIGSGIMRWQYVDETWTPVEYRDVTGEITAFEPSMVRDSDGSLFLTARQTGRQNLEKFDVFLWQSKDNGKTWKLNFHVPKVRSESPVCLNTTPDGRLFISGNLLTGSLNLDSARGNYGYTRDILAFWEIAEDRQGLKSPAIIRCASLEFGPPPTPRGWRIDHPISENIMLSDGKKHCLMSCRVMSIAETKSTQAPTPVTGCYIEEIN